MRVNGERRVRSLPARVHRNVVFLFKKILFFLLKVSRSPRHLSFDDVVLAAGGRIVDVMNL